MEDTTTKALPANRVPGDRMRRLALVGLVALVFFGALAPLAPVASAQQGPGEASVQLSVPTGGLPIPPETPRNSTFTVRYQWTGVAAAPTQIQVEAVEEPPWLDTTFTPSSIQVNNTTSQPNGNEDYSVTATLTIAAGAPAYQTGTAVYRVVAEENFPLPGDEASDDRSVTPDFAGGIDVDGPDGENLTAWGGTVTSIPLEVTSTANGPVAVEASVVLSPADAIVTAPEPFELGTEEGERTQMASIDVQVPWTVSIDGDVAVELAPVHAQRGTEANSVETEFHLVGKSAVPVPGPGPLVVLAGVALVALARARPRTR